MISCLGGNTRTETVPHFWMMAWQQKSPAIVMLCRTHEMDAYGCLRCKCAKYWPKSTAEEDVIRLQDLEIRLLEEETIKDLKPSEASKDGLSPKLYDINNEPGTPPEVEALNQYTVMRKLQIHQPSSNEKRTVTQYHYQKWPDFGAPDENEVENFLHLINLVKGQYPSSEECPNIIHCSAGVGRSGTFCLVDSCLERMTKTGEAISQEQVIETLLYMRRQRMGLIQTDDQFRFALLAISSGTRDALNRARSPQNRKNLKISPNDMIDVPSSSNHSSPSSISTSSSTSSVKDPSNNCNENGVGIYTKGNTSAKIGHDRINVEGIRAISTNGKSNVKDGSLVSKARKRYEIKHSKQANR